MKDEKKQATWRSEWVMFQKKVSVSEWRHEEGIYGTEKKPKNKPRVARVEWVRKSGRKGSWMNEC